MWKEILTIAFVLSTILIFFGLSKLKLNGKPLVGLNNRILISLLFPLLFVFLFTVGIIVLAFVLGALLVLGVIGLIFFFKNKHNKKQDIEILME